MKPGKLIAQGIYTSIGSAIGGAIIGAVYLAYKRYEANKKEEAEQQAIMEYNDSIGVVGPTLLDFAGVS